MIDLNKLFQIINKRTLTQIEVAKKMKIGVRHVKRLTAQKKLHAYKLKSNTLYSRKDIK